MSQPAFGAGIWHFATYVDRYATDGYGPPVTLSRAIDSAGSVGDLSYVDLTYPFTDPASRSTTSRRRWRATTCRPSASPGDLHPRLRQGRLHQPRPGGASPRARADHRGRRRRPRTGRRLRQALARPGRLGLPVPGRPPRRCGRTRLDGVRELAQENPDLRFVIEYKPREPRVKMSFDSVARTLLGIEEIGLPNVGILLDFGHSLYGGESPADAAQLAIDYGRLFGDGRQRQLPRLGRRPRRRHRPPHRDCSSSSTPCARTTGRASGSSTSSRSARTASRPPSRRSSSSRPSTAAWTGSTSTPCRRPRTSTTR